MIEQNYYAILGVKENASLDEIKKAYKKAAIQYHPDNNTDEKAEELFHQITIAYDVLKKEKTRKEYDIDLDLIRDPYFCDTEKKVEKILQKLDENSNRLRNELKIKHLKEIEEQLKKSSEEYRRRLQESKQEEKLYQETLSREDDRIERFKRKIAREEEQNQIIKEMKQQRDKNRAERNIARACYEEKLEEISSELKRRRNEHRREKIIEITARLNSKEGKGNKHLSKKI